VTIDERLEKLVERHEALTRSVAMHDAMIARNDSRLDEAGKSAGENSATGSASSQPRKR
jgi:hypothetical protein